MIRLNVEEYCQSCLDFHPDVIPPTRATDEDNSLTDTIVLCKYRKRCAGIERHLRQLIKEEPVG